MQFSVIRQLSNQRATQESGKGREGEREGSYSAASGIQMKKDGGLDGMTAMGYPLSNVVINIVSV